MKPLNSLILIEYQEPQEKRTDSGIYVPSTANTVTAQDFLRAGKVLEVNADEELIKKGDTVYFNLHAKTVVPGQKDQYFVRKEDLYAVESSK